MKLFICLGVLSVIGVAVLMLCVYPKGWDQPCRDKGGVMVKNMQGYVCVKEIK